MRQWRQWGVRRTSMRDQEATKLIEAVHALAPAISARAEDIEEARRIPDDLLAQLRATGVFRMFVPRSHGGLELDLRSGLEVLEILARADGAVGWTAMIGAETPQVL